MASRSLKILDYVNIATEGEKGVHIDAVKPVHSVTKDGIHDWVINTYNNLQEHMTNIASQQIRNLSLRKGVYYSSKDGRAKLVNDLEKFEKVGVNANYLEELGKQRKAKLTSFIPATRAIPKNSDYSSIQSAKGADKLLDSVKYSKNYKALISSVVDNTYTFGEQPLIIGWDPYAGKPTPEWEKLARKLEQKNPNAIEGEVNGKVINLDRPEVRGDLFFRAHLPYMMVRDPKSRPEDVQWVMYLGYEHIDDVKFDHSKADKKHFEVKKTYSIFNPENMELEQLDDHILIIRFYARSSRFLRSGMYFKATEYGFLTPPEDIWYDDVPSSEYGNLPHEILTDISYPAHLHARSTIDLLSGLQHQSNKFLTMFAKALELQAHPKALLPNGSGVKIESLANAKATVIRYNAPFEPKVVTLGNIPPSLPNAWDMYKNELFQLGGSGPVSQGDIPRGLRSGVALRLVKQFEDIRNADQVAKLEQFILAVDRKQLPIIQKRFPEEFAISIVGEDKQRFIESFKKADLDSVHDLEIQAVNPLSKDPAGQTQNVLDLIEVTANTTEGVPYSNRQILKILEYPKPDIVIDPITVAIDAAERENSFFAEGKKVLPPRPGEDLISHYRTHMPFYRRDIFRDMPEEWQQAFIDHMIGTEYLIFEQMSENAIFAQIVQRDLPSFPSFSVNYVNLIQTARSLVQQGGPNQLALAQQSAQGQLQSVGTTPTTGGNAVSELPVSPEGLGQ